MEINLNAIVIICGNYGSGKTEVAINLAISQKKKGLDVAIADLDLVNPYFRTREARNLLRESGINLILPPEKYMHADLPILAPEVSGAIKNPAELTILDVGGDNAGAMVLAALADSFSIGNVKTLQVVNPNRPNTQTIDGCFKMKAQIEAASNMSVTGIIGNANLMEETTTEHIIEGHAFVKEFSEKSGMALEFITVPSFLSEEIDSSDFSCPVLEISRQLVPPWKTAADLKV